MKSHRHSIKSFSIWNARELIWGRHWLNHVTGPWRYGGMQTCLHWYLAISLKWETATAWLRAARVNHSAHCAPSVLWRYSRAQRVQTSMDTTGRLKGWLFDSTNDLFHCSYWVFPDFEPPTEEQTNPSLSNSQTDSDNKHLLVLEMVTICMCVWPVWERTPV